MVRFWVVVTVALLVLVAGQPAHTEKRIALIIGNGAYPILGVLKNPTNRSQP